jgi:hypothetical protein
MSSFSAAPRSRRLAVIAAGLSAALLASLAMLAGTARADGGGTSPFIQWHAAFSTGQTTDLTVGTVMSLRYVDPTGNTSVKQFCWSPAPIDGPACSPMGTGAPAQAGTQTVTAQLNNGQNVQTTFQVLQANTQLTNGTSGVWSPPVPVTSSCNISLGSDAGLDSSVGMIAVGQQLGAYYQANNAVTQVYDYSTNVAGFIPSVCLNFPSDSTVTYSRTVKLRSNRTQTYRVNLPSNFQPDTARGATAYGYQLYRGTQIGSGVGNKITRTPQRHQPFLGATVTRAVVRNNTISVTIKTGRINNLTLQIAGIGNAP